MDYKGNGGLWDRLDRAENRVRELEEYADKLAAGLPDGMLPADVENLVLQSRDIADMAKQITKITLTVRTLQRLSLNEYYNNQDCDK